MVTLDIVNLCLRIKDHLGHKANDQMRFRLMTWKEKETCCFHVNRCQLNAILVQ